MIINSLYSNLEQYYPFYKRVFIILLFSFFIFAAFIAVPKMDAALYLHETAHIADTIKDFRWIGNEPVGTHGFIFKIIPAVLFNIFGVSTVVAIIYNVVLSFCCIILFEKISNYFFNEKPWILCSILLFSTTYFFIRSTLTYSREIPVLFSTLLFIYAVLKEKNTWLIGVTLLLILDAKEHVFFQITPGIFIFGIYNYIVIERSIKKFLIYNVKLWLFPFLYIVLMLYTGIVPVNSFLIAILPFTERGISSFKNILITGAIPKNPGLYENPFFLHSGKLFGDTLYYIFEFREKLSTTYYAKLFLPRVIGLLSIPMVLFFPGLLQSVKNCIDLFTAKRSIEKKNNAIVLFSFIFISFFLIYYFRASHGRYLFSLSPLIVLFSLQFFIYYDSSKKNFFILFVFFLLMGLFFEVNYLSSKIVIFVVSCFLLYLLLYKNKKYLIMLSIFLALISSGGAILAMATLDGAELQAFIKYGKNEQIPIIVQDIRMVNNVYTNMDNINTARAYKRLKVQDYFYVYKRILKDSFPKKKMLNTYYEEPNLLFFRFNQDSFINDLINANVDEMIIYSGNKPGNQFIDEEEILNFISMNSRNFILKEEMSLKNKNVYIYSFTVESNSTY